MKTVPVGSLPGVEDAATEPAYQIVRYPVWVSGYGDGISILSNRINGMIEKGFKPCGGLYIGKMENDPVYLCQAMYREQAAV